MIMIVMIMAAGGVTPLLRLASDDLPWPFPRGHSPWLESNAGLGLARGMGGGRERGMKKRREGGEKARESNEEEEEGGV